MRLLSHRTGCTGVDPPGMTLACFKPVIPDLTNRCRIDWWWDRLVVATNICSSFSSELAFSGNICQHCACGGGGGDGGVVRC